MAEATPQDQPATPEPTRVRRSRHTLWFLIALYTLAFVWGVRNIYFWEPSRIDDVFPVGFAIVLGLWAIVDSCKRRHPIPLLSRQWFLLAAAIFVPGYVIWSRRWYGVGWLALHAVLWLMVATAVMHLGGLLVFGNRWLRGLGL